MMKICDLLLKVKGQVTLRGIRRYFALSRVLKVVWGVFKGLRNLTGNFK